MFHLMHQHGRLFELGGGAIEMKKNTVNEHPILFSGEMVRAILEGRKTQTRRVIKLRNGEIADDCDIPSEYRTFKIPVDYVMDFSKTYPQWQEMKCPYGQPGDRLWVRESWNAQSQSGQWWHEVKKAERSLHNWAVTNPIVPAFEVVPPRWMPSIHMYRWMARVMLENVDVRVERLQDISDNDAVAEGIRDVCCCGEYMDNHGYYDGHALTQMEGYARDRFQHLWDSINAKRGYSWESNPWVWVIEFKRLESALTGGNPVMEVVR